MPRKRHKRSNIDTDTRVECLKCLNSTWINFADALTSGWPRCCGATMIMTNEHADLEEEMDKVLLKKKVRLRSKFSEKRYIP